MDKRHPKALFGLIAAIAASFVVVSVVSANVGVGVGIGKINVEQILHAGQTYQLPSVPVLNTGDVSSDYSLHIDYDSAQTQMRAPQSWFSFSPSSFHLDPGKVETVNVVMNLPLKVVPGDYFAYVEAQPTATTSTGGTTINVAAATKLYFTVAPSNIFQGIYYMTLSFLGANPWIYAVLALVILAALVWLFKKHFSFNIGISRKQ